MVTRIAWIAALLSSVGGATDASGQNPLHSVPISIPRDQWHPELLGASSQNRGYLTEFAFADSAVFSVDSLAFQTEYNASSGIWNDIVRIRILGPGPAVSAQLTTWEVSGFPTAYAGNVNFTVGQLRSIALPDSNADGAYLVEISPVGSNGDGAYFSHRRRSTFDSEAGEWHDWIDIVLRSSSSPAQNATAQVRVYDIGSLGTREPQSPRLISIPPLSKRSFDIFDKRTLPDRMTTPARGHVVEVDPTSAVNGTVYYWTKPNGASKEALWVQNTSGSTITARVSWVSMFAPLCKVDAASSNFGAVRIGESKSIPVTIRNIGGGTLAGSVTTDCPPQVTIVAEDGTPAYAIGRNQEEQFQIRFAPSTEGFVACRANFGAPGCGSGDFSGVGIDTVATLSPPPLVVGAYQLWSLPVIPADVASGQTSPSLAELFFPIWGQPGPQSWKAYAFEGDSLAYLPEIRAGQGYWLSSLLPFPANFAVTGVEVLWNRLPLRAGWNIVGNPTRFPRNMNDNYILSDGDCGHVCTAVGAGVVAGDMWRYSDQTSDLLNDPGWTPIDVCGADDETSLAPWGAWLLYANRDCELLFAEDDDCNLAPEPRLTPRGLPPDLWSVRISAASGGQRDEGVSLGAAMEASDGWDRYDSPKPPFPDRRLALSVRHDDWPGRSKVYYRSVASAGHAVYEWDLEASNAAGTVALSWSGLEQVPTGYECYLSDFSGVPVRMTGGGSLRTAAEHGVARFRLTITKEGPPDPPDATRPGLRSARPNPMTGFTTITYSVTRQGGAAIEILDLQGRLIKSFRGIPDKPGTWSVQWNGEDDRSHPVASGLYFLRVRIGDRTDVQRIVLLR